MTLATSHPQFDGPLGMANVLKKCANINAAWAALIIEECTRLGLTVRSRSSPLAIAASVHPLTTSDRPPELLDAGANQAINQVDHYGSFVRFFFSLPPPSDNIPARMVLTTLDSAAYKATQTPCGPAHINCQFREPLDDSPRAWSWNCLKGLNVWMPKTEPFTKYIRLQNFCASTDIHGQIGEILDIIQNANQGLLVVGQICTEEDIWATFFLAKHLFWPVVADILSGLRFRKVVTSFPEVEKNFLFLDHLDHVLLSELARSWIKPDVVVQIGSRITSKRIAQMLEDCLPHSYIMVDKHPCRHDPSHIVTHRLQSTITEFVDYILKVKFPRNISRWHTSLQAVDLMVEWEVGFQIHSESSLTEPYIAQVISEVLHRGTTLFIGNSMVIRDADMYGNGWVSLRANVSPPTSSWGLSCCGIRVAANRGASGIDGLLSTAIGFAVGSKKRIPIGETSLHSKTDYIIEVRSGIEENAIFHRIQLYAQHTSTPVDSHCDGIYKDGFILTLSFEDGSVGFGEVAPIEVHKEDLPDVEEQLRFLPSSIFPSVRCGLEMAILNALATRLGLSLSGVILGNGTSSTVAQSIGDEISKRSSGVQICALVDSSGTPKEIALVVAQLVDEGFTTIKLKVARRASPVEDANVIHEIRAKVGYKIKLRVDANRKWTYEQAVLFGSYAKCYNLEYIEEPVCSEDDILTFCEETGLPVALDETIDNIQGDPLRKLMAYVHTGIVAIVIKPSVVGGFENAALIAKWAQKYEKMAVVSSAFESSLSLSAYVQFSYYLEQKNKESCMLKNKEFYPTIAHGLGTYRWLKEDITTEPHKFVVHPQGDGVEASVEDTAMLLQYFRINPDVVQRTYSEQQVCTYQWEVNWEGFSCSFNVQDVGRSKFNSKAAVFLHGFLGTGEDWVPIMKSLSLNMRCISIDLPGHGKSIITRHPDTQSKQELRMSIEVVADMLSKLINDISPGRVVLIGYSLGARIALYMSLRCNEQIMSMKIDGAVIISGSPGLRDDMQRNIRVAQDDERAQYLAAYGVQCFLDRWYTGQLWSSMSICTYWVKFSSSHVNSDVKVATPDYDFCLLFFKYIELESSKDASAKVVILRAHPHFEQIIGSHMQHDDVYSLAKVLSGLSPGRQPSLWEDLNGCKKPLLFIYGEKDKKFKEIAQKMSSAICLGLETDGNHGKPDKVIEIPDCGHAVHLENPLPLINAVRKFLNRME
ncbi:hypothetical protein ACLOJK_035245 [Asimina triloba]